MLLAVGLMIKFMIKGPFNKLDEFEICYTLEYIFILLI